MASGRPAFLLLVAAAVLAAMVAGRPSAVAAEVSEQQVRANIAKVFGVRVLKLRRTRVAGKDAYLVTVMNPGGNFNEAFQVSTLAVDAETGRLIPAFRHRASGAVMSAAPTYETSRQPVEILRPRRSWR